VIKFKKRRILLKNGQGYQNYENKEKGKREIYQFEFRAEFR
jgi:hypothetical protein